MSEDNCFFKIKNIRTNQLGSDFYKKEDDAKIELDRILKSNRQALRQLGISTCTQDYEVTICEFREVDLNKEDL